MFEAKYLICFDGIELVPGLAPLLVLTNKLKKDLKKEKIGGSKRRGSSFTAYGVVFHGVRDVRRRKRPHSGSSFTAYQVVFYDVREVCTT